MANNKKVQEPAPQQNPEVRVSKTEQFFRENTKNIWIGVLVFLLIVFCIFAWNRFVTQPKRAEARAQMFPAESAFRAQNWELALKGDGNTLGFEQIADEYGNKAGASVWLYAGICSLELGEWEEALVYLKKYNGKDQILAARALSCEGDAYVGLEEYEKALDAYEKAARKSDNVFSATYLLKAGQVAEKLGRSDKALECYKIVKDQYPQSFEAYEIDKYIARIQIAE